MRFLPASILSDLQRTEVDEDSGSVEFALDGSLPSVAAIVAFAGAEVDAAAPAGDAADLQLKVDELSEALASQESRLREYTSAYLHTSHRDHLAAPSYAPPSPQPRGTPSASASESLEDVPGGWRRSAKSGSHTE